MLLAYKEGQNAFERLNAFLGINLPISQYLQIYRMHKPNIRLSESAVSAINSLKSSECIIGVITDGRSVQQRNKIEALGVNRWIIEEDVLISEEFGSEKPTPANYEYFMKRYPESDEFMYVGDNLKKDFTSVSTKVMPKMIIKDLKNLTFL